MKKTITYKTDNKDLDIREETNLLELCINNEVPINHVCEGGASCGTCRVIIQGTIKEMPPRSSLEQEMATDRKFTAEERLACQLPLTHSFNFKLPKD